MEKQITIESKLIGDLANKIIELTTTMPNIFKQIKNESDELLRKKDADRILKKQKTHKNLRAQGIADSTYNYFKEEIKNGILNKIPNNIDELQEKIDNAKKEILILNENINYIGSLSLDPSIGATKLRVSSSVAQGGGGKIKNI
jgi:hypothetical protein